MHRVVPSAKTYTSRVPSGPGRTSASGMRASARSARRSAVWSREATTEDGTKSGPEGCGIMPGLGSVASVASGSDPVSAAASTPGSSPAKSAWRGR